MCSRVRLSSATLRGTPKVVYGGQQRFKVKFLQKGGGGTPPHFAQNEGMIGSVKMDCKFAHSPLCIVGETVHRFENVSPRLVVELYIHEIFADDCYISKNYPEKSLIVKKLPKKTTKRTGVRTCVPHTR